MMEEMANEILADTEWEAESETTLITCCGDVLEWDGGRCPTCHAPNPLRQMGLI